MDKDAELYGAEEISTGYHPSGYRIDRSAPPLDRYTEWSVGDDGVWSNPRPVCFHSLPEKGWYGDILRKRRLN